VLEVSSRQGNFQSRFTAWTACWVACGTTLHRTAPSGRDGPENFSANLVALRLNQAVVEIFAWRTTRREFARPKWVLVLPISRRMIISEAMEQRREGVRSPSFFERYIPTQDAFQMAMFGAQEQRAILVERFGAAANFALADLNRHLASQGGAMLFPVICQRSETIVINSPVVLIQGLQHGGGQFRAGHGPAQLNFQ